VVDLIHNNPSQLLDGCISNMMSFQGFSSLGDQSPIILLTNLQSTMHDLISQSDDHHKLKKDLQ
jgi:hypothetical protein